MSRETSQISEKPGSGPRSLCLWTDCAASLLSPRMGHWKGEWLSLGSKISIASEEDPQCDSNPQADGKQNTVCGSTLQPVPVSVYKLCSVCSWLCYPFPLFRGVPIRRPTKTAPSSSCGSQKQTGFAGVWILQWTVSVSSGGPSLQTLS